MTLIVCVSFNKFLCDFIRVSGWFSRPIKLYAQAAGYQRFDAINFGGLAGRGVRGIQITGRNSLPGHQLHRSFSQFHVGGESKVAIGRHSCNVDRFQVRGNLSAGNWWICLHHRWHLYKSASIENGKVAVESFVVRFECADYLFIHKHVLRHAQLLKSSEIFDSGEFLWNSSIKFPFFNFFPSIAVPLWAVAAKRVALFELQAITNLNGCHVPRSLHIGWQFVDFKNDRSNRLQCRRPERGDCALERLTQSDRNASATGHPGEIQIQQIFASQLNQTKKTHRWNDWRNNQFRGFWRRAKHNSWKYRKCKTENVFVALLSFLLFYLTNKFLLLLQLKTIGGKIQCNE